MKRTETFWSRDVIDIWILANYEFKTHKDLIKTLCAKLS